MPLIVHGTDLLGQPFDEPTSTVNYNLHGCRYTSKHHLPRNSWVTIELPKSPDRPSVRARVAWVQRPHSIRDYFQIAVELESPRNVWGVDAPPEDWTSAAAAFSTAPKVFAEIDFGETRRTEAGAIPASLKNFMEELVTHMTNSSPADSNAPAFSAAMETEERPPLLRELNAAVERQARDAVAAATRESREEMRRAAEETEQRQTSAAREFLDSWRQEIEQAQTVARTELSSHLAARQKEFLTGLRNEFEQNLTAARGVLADLEKKTQTARIEGSAAQEASSRLAQARLAAEAAEASRPTIRNSGDASRATDGEATQEWRRQLAGEMAVAQSQWNELLQSSLDSGAHRLVTQLSERSQEILRTAEQRMTDRFAELQHPVAQASAEARETFATTKSALEEEVTRARFSLADIEMSASRMKEYSVQLEAASHDALNELNRRLEQILESQSAELNRRAEALTANLTQRATPALDALGQLFVARTSTELDSLLAPHLERVPELIRELKAREVQAEDSLRLHRERLRQISEQSQREAATQMGATLGALRSDFEAARKEALGKWTDELDASGVRASHAAAESIGRASEWFQQEARARLQVLVEQTLATAGSSFEEKASLAANKFEAGLQEKSATQIARTEERVDQFAGEMVERSRTQIEQASEAAAASFGQVLHGISERKAEEFSASSQAALQQRAAEMELSAQHLLRTMETTVATSLDGFHAQMAGQIEQSIAAGRADLAADFAAAHDRYGAERDTHQQEWVGQLETLSANAAGKYQERLETTGDSWVISSVRRLNEHGQNSIESLIRSADQSLRDSCSRLFEGLAQTLRERAANAAGVAGFMQPPAREMTEPGERPGNRAGD
ncbi:MAG: hypothetical protein WA660_06225 [Candidatus Acidiferrales bacterium]